MPLTPPVPVDALPVVPSIDRPLDFEVEMDNFLGALPEFQSGMNDIDANVYNNATEAHASAVVAAASVVDAAEQVALAEAQVALAATQADNASGSAAAAADSALTAVNAPGTSATSTTSAVIGPGSKALTIQTGKALVPGMWIIAADTSAPDENQMSGVIHTYDSGTGALVFTVGTNYIGSGTITAWTVSLAPYGGTPSISKMTVGTIAGRPYPAESGMFRLNSDTGFPEWYDEATDTWLFFSSPVSYDVEYLLAAGGGGCSPVFGGGRGAGSGAGGFLTGTANIQRGTTYSFVVGAGGPVGTTGVPSVTSNGSDTTGLDLAAIGGGSSAGWDGTPGNDGGSGGGHWYDNTSPVADGVPGQGYAGSVSGGGGNLTGGGGGGSAGAGTVGVGGAGTSSSITGASVTYAAGGDGNTFGGTIHDTNGAANTGDGASGVASGGSGIAVLRIPTVYYSGLHTNATVTTDGAYTVVKFTTSGTYTG